MEHVFSSHVYGQLGEGESGCQPGSPSAFAYSLKVLLIDTKSRSCFLPVFLSTFPPLRVWFSRLSFRSSLSASALSLSASLSAPYWAIPHWLPVFFLSSSFLLVYLFTSLCCLPLSSHFSTQLLISNKQLEWKSWELPRSIGKLQISGRCCLMFQQVESSV